MSDATSRADLPADCPDDTYRPHSFEPLIAAVAVSNNRVCNSSCADVFPNNASVYSFTEPPIALYAANAPDLADAAAITAGAFALKAPVFSSIAPVKSAVDPAASSDDPAKNDNAT